DRGGQVDRLLADLERRGEHLRNTFGESLCVFGMVAGRLQPEEFVAALARQELAGTEDTAHPVRDLYQQLVAGGVTEHVVDVLEAVDVDGERGDLVRHFMR